MVLTMAVGNSLTSAAGVLSLLSEAEEEIKIFALRRLDQLVDNFWAEIAESVTSIEELYERADFQERELAALVTSKVYYHLGAFQDSLTFALGAGQMFDVNGTSEYIETILSKCIDHYTELKVRRFDGTLKDGEEIDPRLEAIVNRMFERCLGDRRYKQAVGIAIETRRIDILERAIQEAENIGEMLSYCLRVSLSLISSPRFRNTVLEVLVRMYRNLETPDYISICQCYIFLDDPHSAAQVLEQLAKGSKEEVAVSYQIAFDLYESATQHFLRKVQETVRGSLPAPPPTPPTQETTNEEKLSTPVQESGAADASSSMETGEVSVISGEEAGPPVEEEKKDQEMEVDQPDGSDHDDPEPEWISNLRSVDTILSGEKTIHFHQQFLIRNNHTDLQILKNTKDCGRNSITRNATVIANGLMHYGTTSDVFLRENLDWLKLASNWAKFTATASLGLIHYGHEKEARNLMSSYLPKDSSGSSHYAEGGGLFAIGLIHANHGVSVMEYLADELRSNNSEIVRHGGCLGLGLAAMGTSNMDAYELLKENLLTRDDAVIGEAAGLAMGLVMLGTNSPMAVEDMVNYARDTQHEKIQRGLALGIAMLVYGQLEEAEALIEDLCRDKDPLLRRAAVFSIAMAYCGSGDNKAIRRLLHIAVSDVDDDVRRAAVTSLGFILFRTGEQCPHVVSLLSESFNPHVRCGSAMALGIACAGTGNKEALSIIEPMLTDSLPFVQQAALVASSMILIQHSEALSSKVTFYRQHYARIIADKHEHNITKFGAILAQGIMDAGGRNITISLQSRTGHMNMRTAVGLLVFSQFWFWYPLCHFLSLAFTPTALIALNTDLKMPKLEFRSNAKPSLYAYPPPLKKEKEKQKEKVATAELSVTLKAKAKEKKKAAAKGLDKATPADSNAMEAPEAVGAKRLDVTEDMDTTDKSADSAKKDEVKKESEPDFELLSNPARVLPQQLKVLSWDGESRYKPLKSISTGGIIIVRDTDSQQQPEDLIEPLKVVVPGQEEEGEEPEPPEPFEWSDD